MSCEAPKRKYILSSAVRTLPSHCSCRAVMRTQYIMIVEPVSLFTAGEYKQRPVVLLFLSWFLLFIISHLVPLDVRRWPHDLRLRLLRRCRRWCYRGPQSSNIPGARALRAHERRMSRADGAGETKGRRGEEHNNTCHAAKGQGAALLLLLLTVLCRV